MRKSSKQMGTIEEKDNIEKTSEKPTDEDCKFPSQIPW